MAPVVLAAIAGAAASPDRVEPITPTEQYRTLLKEFQTAAPNYVSSTNDAERLSFVTRADKATVQLLELVENGGRGLLRGGHRKYGDVKLPYNETVDDVARTDLFEIRHLSVGRLAQEIEGLDQDGQSFKSSDYRGKVGLA